MAAFHGPRHNSNMTSERNPHLPCTVCGRLDFTADGYPKSLRRGRCQRCYMRWRSAGDLAPSCAACGEADPNVLVRKTLTGESHTLCGNCKIRVGHRRVSLDVLRVELEASRPSLKVA